MIPTMQFGKTGHESTRTLFGAAALGHLTQKEADPTLDVLLKFGINHIDTAASYGDAELRIAPWLRQHRKDFFVATKTGERSYEKAREQIQHSLERMQIDQIDLLQLHAVTTDEELDQALGSGGALEAAVEAREQGLVRFIGITSHTLYAPTIHRKALERFDFTSVLLPYNYPLMQIPAYAEDFRVLMQICAEKGVAMQTIKSICRRPWTEQVERYASTWYEPLNDQSAINQAVAYVLGQSQLYLNTAGDVNMLPKVLQAAANLQPLPEDSTMEQLVQQYEMIPLWPEHQAMH